MLLHTHGRLSRQCASKGSNQWRPHSAAVGQGLPAKHKGIIGLPDGDASCVRRDVSVGCSRGQLRLELPEAASGVEA